MIEHRTSSKTVSSEEIEGWLTKDHILHLNHVPINHPHRDTIANALIEGLPMRPNPNPKLQACGMQLYQYTHAGPMKTLNKEKRGLDISAKASMDEQEYALVTKALAQDFDVDKPLAKKQKRSGAGSSQDHLKVQDAEPDYLLKWKKSCSQRAKVDKDSASIISNARQLLSKLAAKGDQPVAKAFKEEINKKLSIFEAAYKSFVEKFGAMSQPACQEDGEMACTTLEALLTNQQTHNQAFTKSMAACKQYVQVS